MSHLVATSLKVFREFLVVSSDGTVDASRVHSLACYEKWLLSRGSQADDNEARRFHRTLSNHVSGVDGRSPFTKLEEEAVLKILRRKKRWPCFANQSHLNYGQVGYRSRGFHEKREGDNALSVTAAAAAEKKPAKRVRAAEVKVEPASDVVAAEDQLVAKDTEYIKWMMTQFTMFIGSFSEFSLQVWESSMGIVRFVLLGRPAACTISYEGTYPQELLERTQAEIGGARNEYYIVVYNLMDRDHHKRVLAQNAMAHEVFGDLSDLNRVTFDPSEAPRILFQVLRALHKPAKRCHISGLKLIGKTDRRIDVVYYVDPASYLLVAYGKWSQV